MFHSDSKRTKYRRCSGTASIELPVCIFISLMCVFYPILDMVMLSTRIAFVQGACLFAAREASTSASFVTDLSMSKSARNWEFPWPASAQLALAASTSSENC